MFKDQSSYICEAVIGTGTFATVFRARHRIAPITIAVKVIRQLPFPTEVDTTKIIREISIHKQLNHPFIVKLFCSTFNETECTMLQEYAPNGSLLDYVIQHGPLSEMTAQYWFLQLVSALDYLHNVQRVVHRDLKLDNILLDSFNNIKLIDFGLSHVITDNGGLFKTRCGSLPYIAPEIILTGKYTNAADIWSLGICLFAITIGQFPFQNDNNNNDDHIDNDKLIESITHHHIQYPSFLSDNLIDLLSKMLCRDPRKRITIDQIKSHSWFPRNHYSLVMRTTNETLKFGVDSPSICIDQQIISVMKEQGINCSGLLSAFKSGIENDLTMLYSVYLRDKQNQLMDRFLKIESSSDLSSRDADLLRMMRVRLPTCGNIRSITTLHRRSISRNHHPICDSRLSLKCVTNPHSNPNPNPNASPPPVRGQTAITAIPAIAAPHFSHRNGIVLDQFHIATHF
jgi:serine/threonine protein kinase